MSDARDRAFLGPRSSEARHGDGEPPSARCLHTRTCEKLLLLLKLAEANARKLLCASPSLGRPILKQNRLACDSIPFARWSRCGSSIRAPAGSQVLSCLFHQTAQAFSPRQSARRLKRETTRNRGQLIRCVVATRTRQISAAGELTVRPAALPVGNASRRSCGYAFRSPDVRRRRIGSLRHGNLRTAVVSTSSIGAGSAPDPHLRRLPVPRRVVQPLLGTVTVGTAAVDSTASRTSDRWLAS